MRVLSITCAAVLCFGPLACGGGGDTPVDGDATISCTGDPRAMSYSPGMSLAGTTYHVVLEKSDPGPPIKGINSWTVSVVDGTGAKVTGATLTAVPYMPDHGHGTSVEPVIAPSGDEYSIDPLYLFMAGLWQVTIGVTNGSVTDTVVFDFCIEG